MDYSSIQFILQDAKCWVIGVSIVCSHRSVLLHMQGTWINLRKIFYGSILIDTISKGSANATGSRPVIQVFNQAPFRHKKRNFVCCNSSGELKIFELFSNEFSSDNGKHNQ